MENLLSKDEQIAQMQAEIEVLRAYVSKLDEAKAMAETVPFLLGLVRHFAGDRRFHGSGGKGWIGLAEEDKCVFWKAFVTGNGVPWSIEIAKALQKVQDGLSPIVDQWELEA